MHSPAQEVLDFWFLPSQDAGHGQPRALWFRKDDGFDAEIRQRFGALIDSALIGDIDHWLGSPIEPLPALAQILVLDQFTRNSFRDTARAFAGDARSLQTARALVASGADRALNGVQRQFAYLPFEHAEDLSHQRTAVQLFQQLAIDEPARAELLTWAQRHLDVVARFGRFPHRNAALKRSSTDQELAFLQGPGSRF